MASNYRSHIIQDPKPMRPGSPDNKSKKMEMGSIKGAVALLHKIAKGEPKCG